MMKVLFIAENDYGSSGHAFAMSLRSIGCKTLTYVMQEHVFDYARHGEVLDPQSFESAAKIVDAIEWCDVVHVIQSDGSPPPAWGQRW